MRLYSAIFTSVVVLALPIVSPASDSAAIEATPVSCVEDAFLKKNSDDYRDDLAVLRGDAAKDKTSETYQSSWIEVKAVEHRADKIKLMSKMAQIYNMPIEVLYGSMATESDLFDLGITSDFGNWACGVGQINVNEWCEWAHQTNKRTQKLLHWPVKEVAAFEAAHPGQSVCGGGFIRPESARPFSEISMRRLRAEVPDAPEYMNRAKYLFKPSRIKFSEVKDEVEQISNGGSPTPPSEQKLRVTILRSFAESCTTYKFGIPALAAKLNDIYQNLSPDIRQAQHYKPGQARSRRCSSDRGNAYPLSVGWLLADAIYNAGTEILPGIEQYRQKAHLQWENVGPDDLVAAIHFALSQAGSGVSDIGAAEGQTHIQSLIQMLTPSKDGKI